MEKLKFMAKGQKLIRLDTKPQLVQYYTSRGTVQKG